MSMADVTLGVEFPGESTLLGDLAINQVLERFVEAKGYEKIEKCVGSIMPVT